MNKDKALDLALEALEHMLEDAKQERLTVEYWNECVDAITAIKQARALDKKAENARELGLDYEPVLKDNSNYRYDPPVAEPVAWVTGFYAGRCVIKTINPAAILPVGVALYTAPPAQRQWTDTDIDILSVLAGFEPSHKVELGLVRSVVRTILRKENT